jgi:hypothetical protein
MPQTPQFKKLRKWNAVLSVLHLAQAIVIFVISNDFKVPVTTSFLGWNSATESLESATNTLANIPVGPLVGGFLLISAVAHAIMASPRFYQWYVGNLKKHINYLRWYEYVLSASLMVVIIGMLSGVYDAPSMIMLFSLTATMNLFGLMMERYNQDREQVSWTAFWSGTFAGMIPWVVLAWYFFAALADPQGNPPTFVYFILGILFVFFASFAVNMVLQYKKVWKWKDYLFGEKVYMILSLVAKSALAWQVFGGTLRPT